MAETEAVELLLEQILVLSDVEILVLSAIGSQCAGCSAANFAPHRIGMAAAQERLSRDAADGIANRYKACAGLGKVGTADMCHYPPA